MARHGKGKPSVHSRGAAASAKTRRRIERDEADAWIDARSESRYADEGGEPTTDEVRERAFYPCSVDESAGMRDTLDGGR